MNNRQRFHATMHYQSRDRVPLFDFSFWNETLPAWHKQGLPAHVNRLNAEAFFGMDKSVGSGQPDPTAPPCGEGIRPSFEVRILEDRGDEELIQQADGVRVVRSKRVETIPTHDSHLLVDRESWEKHYKPRLDPNHPKRFRSDWDQKADVWRDEDREELCFLSGGSTYGWLRNWMGVEAVSMLVYDDPALFEEIIETIVDCTVAGLAKPLSTGGSFDGCSLWEDMCYSGGPLLSPAHFKQYLVPQYRRITDLLYKHGVDVIWVDCDGCIDALAPLWLEAGVNTMFPIEVGTWGGDPVKFRREFGRDMLLMGGVSKHILSSSPRAIEDEVNRLAPLVDEGGYIPMPDHRVPPDVPYTNYLHYLDTARRVWGKGVNLKPVQYESSNTVH